MIKRLVVICLLTFMFVGLKAQTYGNEWINYSKKYYKIKIAQNDIYRVDYATMVAAGIPVSTIDPRNLQIFNKGKEQFIYVDGESDGVFNNTDFIEFYGQKNDGTLDSSVYTNTSFVPNPYYSLFNDTAVYFLTWNSSTTNKRMLPETDVSFSLYSPSSYFLNDEIQSFNTDYYAGETNLAGGTDSRYTPSEGYFDVNVINYGFFRQFSVNTSNVYLLGPNVRIETVVVGASKDIGFFNSNLPDHLLRLEYKKTPTGAPTRFMPDTAFMGYASNKFIFSLPPSALGSTTTDMRYSSMPSAGFISNRTTVSYVSIKYPHTFDLEGRNKFLLYVPDAPSQVKSLLDISNFAASGTVRLYDLTNGKRITVVPNGSNYNALVPNSGAEKQCYITSEGNVKTITSLQPVTATAQFTDYSALAVDSAFIIVTNKKLLSTANDYKNYRNSNIYGGLHNVVLSDIDELYDQFAYGIVKSPLSIKGFSDYLLDTYPSPPQNLFLIGKSLHMRLCRQNLTNYTNCLVPSFGNSSSDNLLTAGLNGTNLEPAIPTGRLAAKSNADVTAYLNKIIEYEDQLNNPPAEWKKQVLHFGGGKFDYEQSAFKAYLNNYKDTIQNIFYGGTVTEFFKTNSAPIQLNSSIILKNLINNGVSLMTFFGHGSATMGFDQSIDDVNSYDPLPGHYPFLLANGCFVGDIHSTDLSQSESFLLTPSKGLVGYLGTAGLGVPYTLNMYSQEFYNQLARKNYNKSIGSTIQKTVSTIQVGASDPLLAAVCTEMNLHGDPSLKLNMYDKPDYEITNDKVFFDLTSEVDSITVYIVRTNIGKYTNDSIVTELIRTFPNGETEEYIVSLPAPAFRDTISFKLPVDMTRGIGMNTVKVTLDAYSEVDEINENNNTTDKINMLIEGSGILPVYPYEFAIIPKDTVTLRASTIDPFAPARNYVFQFDTTDTFNSPSMLTTTINSPGGVLSWKPAITFPDSTVYYWRVSPDSTNPTNGFQWRETSFQYIQNKTGWEQAHFFQFKNDDYQYVQFNRPQRRFDFVNDVKTVSCHNAIYFSAPDYYLINWKLNNYEKSYWHCNGVSPSFNIAVINPVTGENLKSYPGSNPGIYGETHCRAYVQETFEFLVNTPAGRANLVNFLNNVVPAGWYVLAYSMNQIDYSTFTAPTDAQFFTAFESLGSSQIRTIPASRPYVLWGTKGSIIGSATEVVGSSISSVIDFNTSFTTNFDNGTISSPVIGPATSWGSFHWRQKNADGPNVINWDKVQVALIGIKADGTESTLVVFPKDSIDVLNLSAYADASIYPNIRLVASMSDDTLHTPPQMERWQVIYAEIPEGAINPPLGYYISNDTVMQGQTVTLHIPFQNISGTAFPDSLLFTYWNEDINRVNTVLFSNVKKNNLLPNELIIDTLNLNTVNYPGINTLWVEVNPVNQPNSQLEQFHYNNIVKIPLAFTSDNINPLLDVTYDGIHILNRDIISAKPSILIKLKDENQFLALNDTNDFNVFIQSPSSLAAKKVYFGPEMTFVPAVLPNNSCQLNYTPMFTEDGIYQLIVQAKDQSDNQSGAVDYKMSFEVVNRSTITEVMNFPNPFSTSTRFVFTITGTEIPTYFKIQILTITGKVVREITLDELGYIHIGRNITEYAWNGKDQFGDQLANGVYLYRVVTSIRGAAIDRRETDADQYFKKGFGKMYLMR